MKKDLEALGFLLFFLFLFIFFSSSCTRGATEERVGYADKSFRCDITGYVNGKEIEATLTHIHNPSEDGIEALVYFSSPKGVEGVTVTLSANGICNARLGDTVIESIGLKGLIYPLEPIFDVGDTYSVRKTQEGATEVRVCDENCDLKYVFLPNSSVPSQIIGKNNGAEVDFRLTDFSFDFVSGK